MVSFHVAFAESSRPFEVEGVGRGLGGGGGGGEGGEGGGGGGEEGGGEGGEEGEGGGRKRGGQTPQPPAPLDPLSRARTKNSHRTVLRQQSIIYTSHVSDQRGIYTTHQNIRLLSP